MGGVSFIQVYFGFLEFFNFAKPRRTRVVYGQNLILIIIYTTKIDVVVCQPNISETVAGRLMKLAHRPRIASTMIKLISKPILLPILLILVKTIQRIVADPKRFLSPPFDSADSVPSLGHPAPVSGKMLSLFTVLCDYSVWVTGFGAPVSVTG